MKNRLTIAFLMFVFATSGPVIFCQTRNDDPIYSKDEVDVKAKITDLVRPGLSLDCKRVVEVELTMILRKSGDVTDIKIVKSAKCGFDKKAIKSVQNMKFNPAQKNGVAVSQLTHISFRLTRDD